MRLYVASSWRNAIYLDVLIDLREAGFECYDFRNPAPGNSGFAWSDVDKNWLQWTPEKFAALLPVHPACAAGYKLDKNALDWCEACVLVLPCGKSAHLEAGYATGQGKPVHVLLHPEKFEPELMYLLCTAVHTTIEEVITAIQKDSQ